MTAGWRAGKGASQWADLVGRRTNEWASGQEAGGRVGGWAKEGDSGRVDELVRAV